MSTLFPGSQVVLYAMKETTYGTPQKATPTDAFLTLSESFTPAQERENRDDRTESSDFLEQVTGRKSADWEITKLLLPSGNVTIQPDDTHLLEAAFGHLSFGTTAIEYLQATAHTTSLTIRRGVRGGGASQASFQEHVMGAICNKVEFSWGNQGHNNQAQVVYSGMAKEWGFTGNSTYNPDADSTIATDANYVTMPTNGEYNFTRGSQLYFNTDVVETAGGSGIMVDSVNLTTNQVIFTETLDNTHSGASAMIPYNPTGTTTGSPIHAKMGMLSLDGSAVAVKHLGGRITFEDNRGLLNEEVGTDSASEVLRQGKRNVTFSLDMYMKKLNTNILLGGMYNNTASDIRVNIGQNTGATVTFVMKKAKWDMVGPDIADNDMARITLTGRAYGTNGNDSLLMRIR